MCHKKCSLDAACSTHTCVEHAMQFAQRSSTYSSQPHMQVTKCMVSSSVHNTSSRRVDKQLYYIYRYAVLGSCILKLYYMLHTWQQWLNINCKAQERRCSLCALLLLLLVAAIAVSCLSSCSGFICSNG
jgi:hypothetical protein